MISVRDVIAVVPAPANMVIIELFDDGEFVQTPAAQLETHKVTTYLGDGKNLPSNPTHEFLHEMGLVAKEQHFETVIGFYDYPAGYFMNTNDFEEIFVVCDSSNPEMVELAKRQLKERTEIKRQHDDCVMGMSQV